MPVYKKVNKNFFKNWSRNMAYFLGFFCADGNMVCTKRDTYFIAVCSADLDIINALRNMLDSEHKITKRVSDTGVNYRFQIGSKVLFDDLCSLGVMPNKARRMLMPDVPKKYLGDFIRGYFDGDGNVWVGSIHKDRKNSGDAILTTFTSASIQFLRSIHESLKKLGVEKGRISISKNGKYGRLVFSILDSLKLYKIMYNSPCEVFLGRKRQVFERYISLRL